MSKPDLPFRDSFYYKEKYDFEHVYSRFVTLVHESKFQEEDKERILDAYDLASDLHYGQTREKEDPSLPFIIHPLEVAIKLFMMKCSPDEIIAGLLHDIREDVTKIKESDNQAVAEIFRSRVVEVLTRLLSKYRIVDGETVRLSNEEYFKKLSQDMTAIMIKAIDRRTNLMSCGRMLDYALDKPPDKAKEIVEFVRKQIAETFEYIIPLVEAKYAKLGENLRMLTMQLKARLEIAETYLLTGETSGLVLVRPASRPLGG